jgi:small-conductance mechanosensitive channel
MAAPLPKEDRAKIVTYLEQQDLSDLTGVKIKELVKENLGINISQPTASKLKAELMDGSPDDSESNEESSPLKCPTLAEEICAMVETTKPDKTRQLSQEQINAIEHLLQGKSDKVIAETAGVSRQTILEWRKQDPIFIAEVNRRRIEQWNEACERMKSLANRALDVLELQLNSGDPKTSLAAAKYVLQGTQLLGDTNLRVGGPTDPEEIILEKLRREARNELAPRIKEINDKRHQVFDLDLNGYETNQVEEEIEALAKSRLKKAMTDAGLS